MENHLAENIRSARKRAGLTQEQLADRLGITLGTVSKWERGASEPEIGFLMDLAEVFRISVDALIGFSMKGGDAATEAERIESLFGNAEFEDILDQYKQALKRFPNYFRIVLGAAEAFDMVGTVHKKDDALKEALSLYRHALELFPQNTDPKISEAAIHIAISQCYCHLKDYKRAVEEYKKNNVCGLNDAMIAAILIGDLKQDKEGIDYLESAFLNRTGEMISIFATYAVYYLHNGDYERGIRALRWAINYLDSLKDHPEERGYIDKVVSIYNMSLAIMYDVAGQAEASDACLDTAIRMAGEFDRAPISDLNNLAFTTHIKKNTVYDDIGATAVEALYGVIDLVKEYVSDAFRQRFEEKLNSIP